MRTEEEIRQSLRDWIIRTNNKIRPEELTDETPIIERRIISSLQVMDLILFLERLSDKPIEADDLKPGVFQNIDSIYKNFFEGDLIDRP
jgi:acyl carrier protein